MTALEQSIFSIKNEDDFNRIALEVFDYQVQNCLIYRTYTQHLGVDSREVAHYIDIPFLPIEFFKKQDVIDQSKSHEIVFTSSGTTGMATSRHLVAKKSIYETSYNTAFQHFYGDIQDTAILALLPSYLERSGSSLIYMVNDLIGQSNLSESGYFLYNHDELHDMLLRLKESGVKTVLFGVTYALLDFIEQFSVDFPELIIIETGGMKGQRKEMIREELHLLLAQGFGVEHIHSEYGMTELMSQAYSKGNGLFQTPPWMKVLIRDTNDPLSLLTNCSTGGINIIDLANLYSCSFIATQDLGKIHPNHHFEILGRFDNSDIRGCNLLVQ